jgi:hypothetical protein
MGNWVAVYERMEYMERIGTDGQVVAGIGMRRRGVPGWKLVHCVERSGSLAARTAA